MKLLIDWNTHHDLMIVPELNHWKMVACYSMCGKCRGLSTDVSVSSSLKVSTERGSDREALPSTTPLRFGSFITQFFFLSLRSRRTQDMIENLLPDYEYCTHFNVCYHSSQNSITADVTLDVAINRMECNLIFVSVCYQNYETILYLHWLPFSSRTWQLQLQLKLIVPLVRKTNMTRSTMTNHKPK